MAAEGGGMRLAQLAGMRTILSALLLAVAVQVSAESAASACGGCFAPPETITSVDSHRMVVSLSADKTILWDQIRYTGAPEDFVWVLPVPTPDTTIDVADSLFFDELEAYTAPNVLGPSLPPAPFCGDPSGPWPGGSGADAGASGDAGVDIYQEAVVGPYQTVIIGSEDPTALLSWLNGNGYNVPTETLPVLNHYIDQGSKFVVLRLAPDEGVEAMQPIRIEFPGYMATFPLKMVTVGAWGTVDLTLWVIAEQRYEAKNYGTVEIPENQLVWDFATNRSNYTDLFRATIDAHGGRAWVAQYAEPLDYLPLSSFEEVQLATENIPYAFLTRLRTDQLLEHLSEDLILAPSANAEWISRTLFASTGINAPPPPPPCPTDWVDPPSPARALFGCAATGASGWGGGLLLLGIAAVLRRRR